MYELRVKQKNLAYEEGYTVDIEIGVQTFSTMVWETEEEAEWAKGCIATGLDKLLAGEWIDCKERMPDEGVPVLTFPYGPITVRHTKKDEDGNLRWFFDAIPVTHWRPLPLGPKGEKPWKDQ